MSYKLVFVFVFFNGESIFNTEISSSEYPAPNNYHEVANILRDDDFFRKEFFLPEKESELILVECYAENISPLRVILESF